MTKRIHIKIADRGWILEKCAKEIAAKAENVTYNTEIEPSADIQYYINYSARTRRVSPIEIAFFTHSERDPTARQRYFDAAAEVDHCICMSARYANELIEYGIAPEKITTIAPGVDLDLFYPKVRIGVVGRTYHTGRKGESLVAQVMDVPGIEWCFTGSGWPGPSAHVPDGGMPDFYNSLDYVLVPALYEGGPMAVLEGLACGIPIITSDVGWAYEYPHIPFENGNADSLRRVLESVVAEREALRASILPHSWVAWAHAHLNLFEKMGTKVNSAALPTADNDRSVIQATLLTHGLEQKALGGPSIRVPKTAEELAKIGVRTTLLTDCPDNFPAADVAHIFNVWPADACFEAVDRAQAAGKTAVLSPIFLNLSNIDIAANVIPKLFSEGHSRRVLDTALMAIANQIAEEPNLPIREPFEGYHDRVRACVDNADEIIFLSGYERRCIEYLGARPKSANLVYNPVDAEKFANADPELFAKTHQLDDYILCVGRIEPRKNQLILAHAARTLGKKIVFVGHTETPVYYELVRKAAGDYGLFIPRLDPGNPLLSSAFAGASVFCLPSWAEGAPLAALEAAAAGAPLVLSDRSSEREYFSDYAEYVNPADIRSMREALTKAAAKRGDLHRRKALQEHIRKNFNWDRYALETAAVYAKVERSALPTLASICPPQDKIYFDLTTTFHASGHPTGIARVEGNTLQALMEQWGARLIPIVWNSRTKSYLRLNHSQALLNPDLAKLEKMESTGAITRIEDSALSGGRIIVVGGSWIRNREYISALRALKIQLRANLTVLVHDLIQMKLSHLYPQGVGSEFEQNARLIAKVADHFLVYSDYTWKDLRAFLVENGQLYKKISKFRLGDMVALHPEDKRTGAGGDILTPIRQRFDDKTFAIFVSSIEIRKNHALLINVWRRLIEERGESTPHLLFIGRTLWRGEEIVVAVQQEEKLRKFVHVLSDVDDDDLDWFYRNCSFTVFPSLYEGWGLPVAESLSYGKLCITSGRTATREVAPDLTELIDPYDFKAWRDRISFYLDNPLALKRMEKRICAEYREHSWDEAVREIVAAADMAPTIANLYAPVFPRQIVDFSSSAGKASAFSICGSGWANPENAGRWSIGDISKICFRYPAATDRFFIRLQARALTRSPSETRSFTIEINGMEVLSLEIGELLETIDLEVVPNRTREVPGIEIAFRPREKFSPSSISMSADKRELGIFVTRATFGDDLSALPSLAGVTVATQPAVVNGTSSLTIADIRLQRARELITLPPRFVGKRPLSRLAKTLGIDRMLLRRHARRFRRTYSSLDLIIDYLKDERR